MIAEPFGTAFAAAVSRSRAVVGEVGSDDVGPSMTLVY
jgi:hypothetical protein